ncbi:MAG: M81 family peptidase [Deltaproteobacteria bacterium]|nr:MAG: M81 family peptidase [Deltaproteobacteria bacterium]
MYARQPARHPPVPRRPARVRGRGAAPPGPRLSRGRRRLRDDGPGAGPRPRAQGGARPDGTDVRGRPRSALPVRSAGAAGLGATGAGSRRPPAAAAAGCGMSAATPSTTSPPGTGTPPAGAADARGSSARGSNARSADTRDSAAETRATSGRLRIGLLRFAQESNALSPVRTEVEDFRRTHLRTGEDLLQAVGPRGVEAPGFLAHAELSGFARAARRIAGDGIELVPLMSAWAVPGGPLSRAAQAWFCAEVDRLLGEAGRLDAVFISLHGAMRGEGGTAPEADILALLRRRLGSEVVLAATVDLHAHLTPALVEPLSVLVAYRTNPHRDHARAGARAAEILVPALLGQLRPTMTWRSLPMVLGGGTTIDFLPTMRPVFRRMRRMERDPRVLSVSLCMCHIWSDAPDLGWGVVAITDDDAALADALADELADAAWALRHRLPPELPDAAEALQRARAARWRRRFGTVCISDASDMVGAGAAGESTRLLSHLLAEGQGLRILAPIRDAAAVAALWDLPDGSEVAVTLGGRLDPDNPPLPVQGRLRRKRADTAFGRCLLLDLDHVQLVVTEGPPLAMKPSFYRDMGLRPWFADICVVKSLFPFRLYFLWHNRLTIYARTRGQTDFDVAWRMQFDGPVHPKDPVDDWRPADRRRRALPQRAAPISVSPGRPPLSSAACSMAMRNSSADFS